MWPWLTACAVLDRQPPEIEVQGPETPVRQSATFRIRAHDDQPGLARLVMTVDGARTEPLPLPDDVLEWVLGLAALDDGEHTVTFTAIDSAWMGNAASVQALIQVDTTPPTLQLPPGGLIAAQGKTLPVWIRSDELLVEPTVTFGDRTLPLFPVDGAHRALLGIEIRQALGPQPLTIRARDRLGNEAILQTEVEIVPTIFEAGDQVDRPKPPEARREDPARDKMRSERDAAYAHDDPQQRWGGPLGLPVAYGTKTSSFGRYLEYSDGNRNYHTGMDLAKRPGARISAAAPGVVVLAHSQAVFGKVVILDHGHGVITTYNHLKAVVVSVGDEIAQGQIIGTMGSTGQSNGPHLHWGLVVGRVAVDPDQWLSEDFSSSPFP